MAVETPPTFNPNEGIKGVGKPMLPNAEYPIPSMAPTSIDDYVKCFTDIAKAIAVPPEMQSFARISYMPEIHNSGVLQWPGVPPESLTKISRENLAPLMIIGTRVADVLNYAELSGHPWKPGWRVELREAKKHPSRSELADIREAEKFLLNCNIEYTGRERDDHKITSFRQFLAMLTRNSLTYDGMAIWTDMDEQDRVQAFKCLSAANIRLAGRNGYQGDLDKFAVAVDDAGNVIESFTRKQLTWYVRNPRADADIGAYGYAEIEQAIRVIQGFQSALDLNVDAFCYSEDTEVLTSDGWKFFDQVDISVDRFATINLETREMQYQKATDHIWQDYSGEMYALKSRSIDMVVTPNHRVIYEYRPSFISTGKHKLEVCEAHELYDKFQTLEKMSRNNYAVPITSVWKGKEIEEKSFAFGRKIIGGKKLYEKTKIHGGSRELRTISGDDYCAFMGAYLSEGWLAGTKKKKIEIRISQKTFSKGFAPFKELLKRVFKREVQYNENVSCFIVSWDGFLEHLSQFGTYCYNKIIPEEILNATPRQQKIFWDYFVLGDGSTTIQKNGSSSTHIATTSKIMADQFQELCQKMGYAATICTVMDPMKYRPQINGRMLKACRPRYDVGIKTSPMQSMDMYKVDYMGKIGCVTVPNGTLYVRRKGKAIWSGNSKNKIPNGMLLLKGGGWVQRQIDALARIWTNLKSGVTKAWALPVMAVPKDGDVEVLDLSDIKGKEAYYEDFMNMVAAALCVVFRFPPKRLGYRISGHGKDSELPNQTAKDRSDDEDIGRYELLGHIQLVVNEYVLWTRFPHLQFVFTGKNPKEDAREYEARSQAMTVNERRAQSDLAPLAEAMVVKKADSDSTDISEEMKQIAEIMGNAPTDPALTGIYQAAVTAIFGKAVDGTGPESMMGHKKDPAASEQHGHMSGVRRDSASEAASAATSTRAGSNATKPKT
ncbi:MAG: LAGLIDADG family homing endonuclease [Sulfobacillus sp.]